MPDHSSSKVAAKAAVDAVKKLKKSISMYKKEPSYMSNQTAIVAAIAAAGATYAATYAALWMRRKKRLERLARDHRQEGCEKIKLLPHENSFVIKTSLAMNTITFFDCDSQAQVEAAQLYFEDRTQAIVDANPWLAGFLDIDEADPNHNLALYVPPTKVNSQGGNSFQVLDTLGDLDVSDYYPLVEKLGAAMVGTTVEHVASLGTNISKHGIDEDDRATPTWEPLWRVTFLPQTSKDSHRFGIVVSGNHSVMDGHGYYKLFNMLSSQESIQAMSPIRKDLKQRIDNVTGSEPSVLEAPPIGFIMSFIASTVFNAIVPQTESTGFLVDPDWIAQGKARYRNSNETTSDARDAPPFVSTNDLVVSTFCREADVDMAIMAINMRGRANQCTDDLVGNYEHLLSYGKEDCITPSSIRKSIMGRPYQRVGASSPDGPKLPTNFQHLFGCKYAAITNWATFAKDVQVEAGNKTLIQSLHLPLFDFPKSTPACTYCSMVVFQPKEGTVGILAGGKASLMERLAETGMVGSLLYTTQ